LSVYESVSTVSPITFKMLFSRSSLGTLFSLFMFFSFFCDLQFYYTKVYAKFDAEMWLVLVLDFLTVCALTRLPPYPLMYNYYACGCLELLHRLPEDDILWHSWLNFRLGTIRYNYYRMTHIMLVFEITTIVNQLAIEHPAFFWYFQEFCNFPSSVSLLFTTVIIEVLKHVIIRTLPNNLNNEYDV
jgi:hypothetical protein